MGFALHTSNAVNEERAGRSRQRMGPKPWPLPLRRVCHPGIAEAGVQRRGFSEGKANPCGMTPTICDVSPFNSTV